MTMTIQHILSSMCYNALTAPRCFFPCSCCACRKPSKNKAGWGQQLAVKRGAAGAFGGDAGTVLAITHY